MLQSRTKISQLKLIDLALEGAKAFQAKALKGDDPAMALSMDKIQSELKRRKGISKSTKGIPWSAARHKAHEKMTQGAEILSWPKVTPKPKTQRT